MTETRDFRTPKERARDLLSHYRDVVAELGFSIDPIKEDTSMPLTAAPYGVSYEYGFHFGIDVPGGYFPPYTRHDSWELFARYDEDTDNVQILLQAHTSSLRDDGAVIIQDEDQLVRELDASLSKLK